MANHVAVHALAGRGDLVLADKLSHASVLDAAGACGTTLRTYPHGDLRRLANLLDNHRAAHRRCLLVTDSLFSMDGDLAPLAELAALARRYDCMLLVDEAHATGVWGHSGRGLAEELGVEEQIHVRVGTLSKALAGIGGFACGPKPLVEWLVNRARPFVFSTALPPAVCAAALAALDLVREEPSRGAEVRRRAAGLRTVLAAQGWNLGASASQIIPLVVGDARAAVRLAGQLLEQGWLVPAIRPPSVAEGRALLRISLSSGHDEEMVARLAAALARVAAEFPGS